MIVSGLLDWKSDDILQISGHTQNSIFKAKLLEIYCVEFLRELLKFFN